MSECLKTRTPSRHKQAMDLWRDIRQEAINAAFRGEPERVRQLNDWSERVWELASGR